MKCLYCAEEIQDDAVVCKHCGRDFAVLQPLLERLNELEREVAALRPPPAAPRERAPAPAASARPVGQGGRPTRITPWRGAAALGLTTGIVVAESFAYYWFQAEGTGAPLAFLSMLTPFFIGLWLGISVAGRHPLGYCGLGVGMGLVWCGLTALGVLLTQGDTALYAKPDTWVVSVFLGLIFSLSGGLIGDWLELRLGVSPGPGRWAEWLARRLPSVRSRKRSRDEERRFAGSIEKLGAILAILTAVATFLDQGRALLDSLIRAITGP